MPPAYVKPCVKRHKNDAIDAEAICEAVTSMLAGARRRRGISFKSCRGNLDGSAM
jgi:hypothetical protein